MPSLFLKNALFQAQFMLCGNCLFWNSELVGLHVIGDLFIAFACYSIPLTLIYFIGKRTDVPLLRVFWTFGAFLFACGTTHLLEVWTLWHPDYWLSGFLKIVTAGVSLYTVVGLIALTPKVIALPSPAQLELVNQELAAGSRENKNLMAALTQSEELFRSIFEGAVIGIALTDMSGNIVAANPALAEMLGYSESELVGHALIHFVYPEDTTAEEIEGIYQNMISGEQEYYQVEKRYLTKEEQIRWANVTISLIWGVHHQPQYSLSLVEDITSRKQVEAELQEYRESLEEIVKERTADLAQINEQLFWQANYDELTQLLNRRAFRVCLNQRCKEVQRDHAHHTLCYLDLDHFKPINDTCGHQAGDELLRQVSRLFESCCRQSDTLCRLGGDEFAILLYQCSLENAERTANSILEKFNNWQFAWEGHTFELGVSIGLAEINAEIDSPESILIAADHACYEAKRLGRNRFQVHAATR